MARTIRLAQVVNPSGNPVAASDVLALPSSGGTMTGLLKVYSLAEVSGNITTGALDVSTGTVFRPSWSTNTTVSLTNLPGSPATGDTITATILATITGTPVLTWPGSTRWIGGSAPTIAAGRLVVTLIASWTGSIWEYYASGGMAS